MHRHCGLYLVKEAPVFLLLTLLAVIDDANIESSKSVNLVVHYSDGSDPDTVVISDPQLEPFMVGAFPYSYGHANLFQWELYNRCPHVPAFAFTSEIAAVGSNADFVDLLLLRCRFDVGTDTLPYAAWSR